MYLKQFQNSIRKKQASQYKLLADLNQTRRVHKSISEALSKDKRKLITNEITLLETTWKKLKVEKDIENIEETETAIKSTVPKTKIFLTPYNCTSRVGQIKHKTINISTGNSHYSNSIGAKCLQSSPTKPIPNKWQKEAKISINDICIKQPIEKKCNSPIKRYLERFKQISKQANTKHQSSNMEIEDILFRQNNR